MSAPFTTLIHQVITILTAFSNDYVIIGEAAKAYVSDDAYQQGNAMYLTVRSRFNQEADDGEAGDLLELFMKHPKMNPGLLQEKLDALLQADEVFANKLRRITSQTIFIGHDQELQDYAQFLREDSPWIWIITALEGSGKTVLLKQMKKKTPSDIVVVKLDFLYERLQYDPATGGKQIDALKYLEQFADQLREYCDPQKYDEFEKELAKANSNLNNKLSKFSIKKVFDSSSTIKDNTEFMKKYNQWIHQEMHQARKQMLLPIRKLVDSFTANHLVIHLDACEWLMEPVNAEVRQWLLQDILLRLYQSMHEKQKKCHVVLMSNVPMLIPDSELSDSDNLKRSSLDRLDKQSVQHYLQRIGVDDPQLSEQFYDMTDGHAFCIGILRDLWQQWEKEGKQASDGATLIQFQREFYEKTEKEFISKNVLEKFKGSPLYTLTKYGSLLQEFSLPLLMKVFQDDEHLSQLQAKNWFDLLTNRLYIICTEQPFKYKIIELFRTALGQSIRVQEPEKWQSYHKSAMEFFQSQTTPLKLPRSRDWHYHQLAYYFAGSNNEEPAKRYWIETLESLKDLGINPLTPLLQAANDKTLMFTSVAFEAQKYQ